MPKSKVRKKGGGRVKYAPTRWSPRHAFSALDMAQALPPLTFPEDLLGLDAPEHTRIVLDLAVADPEGSELFRLPLDLTRRLRKGDEVHLWGSAADGLVTVHLTGRAGTWAFQGRVDAENATGTQCKHLIDVTLALVPPNQVALALPHTPPTRWVPLLRAATDDLPETTIAVVSAHAAIERAVGVSRQVRHYTAAERQNTIATAMLLRGEPWTGTWSEFTWDMTLGEAHELVDGLFLDGGSARFETEHAWRWVLGGEPVDVGIVHAQYESVVLDTVRLPALSDDNANKTVTLRLLPGENATVTYRLLEVTSRPDEAAPDQRWFWTPEWQRREREVDEHLAAGRVETFESAEDFLAHLDELAAGE